MTYKICVKGISSFVTICENERLVALARGPQICEWWGIPVDFVEDMGGMDVAFRAVLLSIRGTGTAWPDHVVLVVIKASCRVVAGGKVNISTQRRGITIAVLIWKASTCTFVVGILHSTTVQTVRVRRVRGRIIACARACELDWLWRTGVGIGNRPTAGSRGRSELNVAYEHAVARFERDNIIISSLEAGHCQYGTTFRIVRVMTYK